MANSRRSVEGEVVVESVDDMVVLVVEEGEY